ncbi:CDP-diacylglycerol--glycerol-3-phosphate 3-phosphatidyltransferase, mitochondrial isoform X2 [Belonocnema kinseyi]|uniref:CDP-diacylglycerol--glycerol-3-phosphate 3-phosphatidyltransferase, mitochondrial isoform X2 n=1 Tax=Belonocnema kinseyi TaxID=2817044 RepID=UPI00143D7FAB|nr:CDP-diacylglycerol--glycerol-3-phosphate 3-phosphatidyltransferase, mitochondrial isoform X2 [Belonocnema kinseyi]
MGNVGGVIAYYSLQKRSNRIEGLRNLRKISTHSKMCKEQITVLDDRCRLSEIDTADFEISSLSWLHKVAPGFPVNGSKITIIEEPAVFYSTLLENCKTAKKRIVLSSLYIGTGKLETKLVETIEKTLNDRNGNLKVNILLDYMRGSRGKQNSRQILQPFLNGKWKNAWNVFLYHTPKLRGFLKSVTPDRFNEMIGLQHMKLYLFDNTLIISGANLSNDYFTNRQDRYFVIEDCEDLCDFYTDLVEKVGEFSFRLMPDGNTVPNSTDCDPLETPSKKFTASASGRIRTLFQKEMEKRSGANRLVENVEADTWIFPLVQMSQLNIWHDSEVTLRLLKMAPSGATLRLATGYFNLTTDYRNALLHESRAVYHLLTAHPTANGFFGAKGIAGGIPAAYTKIEESFCKLREKMHQTDRITLWEFMRPGWTYHAKGLWYTLPNQQKPSLTLIGSPNFGYRSVERDLETQIAVVTKNEKLQTSLQAEYERLFKRATPVNSTSFRQEDRIPPVWVRAVVLLFRYYF